MPVNIKNMLLNLVVANSIDCIWIMNRPLFNPVFAFVLLTVHNTAQLLKCYGQNFFVAEFFTFDAYVFSSVMECVVFYKVLTFTKIFDCQLEKQGPNFIVPLLNSNCFLSISIRTFSARHFKVEIVEIRT